MNKTTLPSPEISAIENALGGHSVAFESDLEIPINRPLDTFLRIIRLKRVIALVVIFLLVTTGFLFKGAGYFDPEVIFGFLNTHPLIAPLSFIALLVAMSLLLLPTLPLNLGAGFLWGPYVGGLYVLTGSSLAAAIAFLIARYLAGEFLNQSFRHPRWAWVLDKVRHQDWKTVAFTRINPIFPTALLNYFFGLTSIKFTAYILTTVIFIAPMTLLFAYLGDSIGGFLMQGRTVQFVQNILGASTAITILLLLRFGLKRLFKDQSKND